MTDLDLDLEFQGLIYCKLYMFKFRVMIRSILYLQI